MSKVFILIEKRFLVSGNTDYAMAVDNTDINVFADLGKADDEREELMNFHLNHNAIIKHRKLPTAFSNSDYVELGLPNGVRIILEIIEKEVR